MRRQEHEEEGTWIGRNMRQRYGTKERPEMEFAELTQLYKSWSS
jgi:hypothetical protein